MHVKYETSIKVKLFFGSRNVIGSALAEDMSLKRENLVAVAVLSVNMEKEKNQRVERETNSWLEEKGDDTLHTQLRTESFDATCPTASSPTGSLKDRNHKSPLPSSPSQLQSSGGVSKFPEMLLCGTCGRDELCNCVNLNQSPTSRKFVLCARISILTSYIRKPCLFVHLKTSILPTESQTCDSSSVIPRNL